jgi:hypothetical protein
VLDGQVSAIAVNATTSSAITIEPTIGPVRLDVRECRDVGTTVDVVTFGIVPGVPLRNLVVVDEGRPGRSRQR